METIYRKKCGCNFKIVLLDKDKDYCKIQFIKYCDSATKDNEIKLKYLKIESNEAEVKYTDLLKSVEIDKVDIDTMETIKTLEKENGSV